MKKFDLSHIVCSCANVTLGEIKYFIDQNIVKNLKNLQDLCEAGTYCKYCIKRDRL